MLMFRTQWDNISNGVPQYIFDGRLVVQVIID